jgi:hypothetical protein
MESAFMVPILEGKTEAAREFARQMMADGGAKFNEANVTVTKESWFIQETPMGDFLIVYCHAPDPNQVGRNLAAAQDPIDVWFKQQVLDITGIDINDGMPDMPEQIVAWER